MTQLNRRTIAMDIGLIVYGGLCIVLGLCAIGFAVMFIMDDFR